MEVHTKEVTGEQSQLCNEEIQKLYSVPNSVVIKWTRVRLVGHLARIGKILLYFGSKTWREDATW
jgi:hypothetical protein